MLRLAVPLAVLAVLMSSGTAQAWTVPHGPAELLAFPPLPQLAPAVVHGTGYIVWDQYDDVGTYLGSHTTALPMDLELRFQRVGTPLVCGSPFFVFTWLVEYGEVGSLPVQIPSDIGLHTWTGTKDPGTGVYTLDHLLEPSTNQVFMKGSSSPFDQAHDATIDEIRFDLQPIPFHYSPTGTIQHRTLAVQFNLPGDTGLFWRGTGEVDVQAVGLMQASDPCHMQTPSPPSSAPAALDPQGVQAPSAESLLGLAADPAPQLPASGSEAQAPSLQLPGFAAAPPAWLAPEFARPSPIPLL